MRLTAAQQLYYASKLEEAAAQETNRDAQQYLLDTAAGFRMLAHMQTVPPRMSRREAQEIVRRRHSCFGNR